MKTRYQNHKTFKNSALAEAYLAKIKPYFPERTFSIRKRTFPGKLKTRYTVRSVPTPWKGVCSS